MDTDLFWIDHATDRDSASDQVSRYGVYVGKHIPGGFDECWDGTWESRLPERFTALAWQVATTPVMSPPSADWRSPVQSARFGLDHDGGSEGLLATVEIAAPWPRALAGVRGRVNDVPWYSWRTERMPGGRDYLRGPYEDEVARNGDNYALTTLRLVFHVRASLLPAAPGPRDVRRTAEIARGAVAALTVELNRVAGPVVETLERS